ncbi:MAG TPA: hypothetical protein VF656_10120 [Pyrinomonadaceae bacterium]
MANSKSSKQKKQETQRKAFNFLVSHLRSQETFTLEEFRKDSGWDVETFRTYRSKQFKAFIEEVGNGQYQVRETFRPYVTWPKFQQHVTQVKRVVTNYTPLMLDNVVIYEFYMPLANEGHLRTTLDSLFFRDTIIARLKTIGIQQLTAFFGEQNGESDDYYFQRILKFIEQKFAGYSIFHVNGRFRAGKLATQDEVAEIHKQGQRYLIDETTAVTRFIFPCGDSDTAERVRFLFRELFVRSIIQLINGEDEIWMIESGMRTRAHIWKVNEDDEGTLFE